MKQGLSNSGVDWLQKQLGSSPPLLSYPLQCEFVAPLINKWGLFPTLWIRASPVIFFASGKGLMVGPILSLKGPCPHLALTQNLPSPWEQAWGVCCKVTEYVGLSSGSSVTPVKAPDTRRANPRSVKLATVPTAGFRCTSEPTETSSDQNWPATYTLTHKNKSVLL